RAFKVPGYPVVPVLATLSCLFLMGFLTLGTWVRFLIWMAIGLVIYFTYSKNHSKLANEDSSAGTSQEA
ncbi:MAG TPA: amino acid permease C-terminal domain-containing protein, partial [Rubrobacter sp.]|nr:amino acid permease C-terminal domain-containing protein [Rubrobacter sp.]